MDKFFPSSKMYNKYGYMKEDLKLLDRTITCSRYKCNKEYVNICYRRNYGKLSLWSVGIRLLTRYDTMKHEAPSWIYPLAGSPKEY